MVIRIRTNFGTTPVMIDGFVSLRGMKIQLDDVSEIIIQGDDFCVDVNREDEKVRITTQ